MLVYVKSKDGVWLMPTTQCKARRLLKQRKAIVTNRTPFSISLLYRSEEHTQPISVGIDPGKTVGLAAVNHASKKPLFVEEVTTRSDIKKSLDQRRSLRRGRRNRNTRYRKARFQNRRSSKSPCKVCYGNTKTGQQLCSVCLKNSEKGHHDYAKIQKLCFRVPPSIRSRWGAVVQSIAKIPLPTPSKIVVEDAYIDIRALKGDNPQGKEYQKPLYIEKNAKAACRNRDKNTCFRCKGSSTKDRRVRIEVHHILEKKNGGTDIIENLVCLCKQCHYHLHNRNKPITKKELSEIKESTVKYFKNFHAASFRNKKGISKEQAAQLAQQGKKYFYSLVTEKYGKECLWKTYGFWTAFNRKSKSFNKSHIVDALVITDREVNYVPEKYIKTACVRSRKRQLHEQYPPKNGKKKRKISASKENLNKFAYEKVMEDERGKPILVGPRGPRNVSFISRKSDGQVFHKHSTVKLIESHKTKKESCKKGTTCFVASFSGNSVHLKRASPDGKKSLALSVSLNKLHFIHRNKGRLSELDNVANTYFKIEKSTVKKTK